MKRLILFVGLSVMSLLTVLILVETIGQTEEQVRCPDFCKISKSSSQNAFTKGHPECEVCKEEPIDFDS